MANIRLRDAKLDDLERLVSMNLELIEDEAYDVPLPREEVEKRMRGFLQSPFRIFLFESDQTNDETVGYAVMDMSRQPIYLRHFYICRNERRLGHGRKAFAQMCETLSVDSIDVEVMAWNDKGKQFWQDLGFTHRYEGLRWTIQS